MRWFSRLPRATPVVVAGCVCAWGLTAFCRGEETSAKPQAGDEKTFSKEQLEFFEKQVQPVLKARCLKCHGGEEKIRGGLKLTSRSGVLKGGDQGAAVDLKDPGESLLIQAINYDGLKMPPSGKLPILPRPRRTSSLESATISDPSDQIRAGNRSLRGTRLG